jgi:hypothetical protein
LGNCAGINCAGIKSARSGDALEPQGQEHDRAPKRAPHQVVPAGELPLVPAGILGRRFFGQLRAADHNRDRCTNAQTTNTDQYRNRAAKKWAGFPAHEFRTIDLLISSA